MRRPTLAPLVLLLVLALGACAPGLPNPFERRGTRAAVNVQVENRSFADIVVFAVRGGARQRLGLVTATSRAEWELPRDMVATGADVSFLLDPVGSDRTWRTPSVPVLGGETLVLTLVNDLDMSTLVVR